MITLKSPAAYPLGIHSGEARTLDIALLRSAVLEDSLAVSLLHHRPHLAGESLWVRAKSAGNPCLGHSLHPEVPLGIPVVFIDNESQLDFRGFSDDLLRLFCLSTVKTKLLNISNNITISEFNSPQI